jgi:hypothetical protein
LEIDTISIFKTINTHSRYLHLQKQKMNKAKNLFLSLLITLILSTLKLSANSDSTQLQFVQLSGEMGKIWAHDTRLAPIVSKPLKGLSFSFGERVSGNKNWHSAYKFPLVGGEISVYDFGNSSILGYSVGFNPFIIFPIAGTSKYTLGLKVSPGLNYVSKVYNLTKNPTNIAISTHINAQILLGVENTFRISNHIDFIVGLNMIHVSNATFQKPNTGLNSTSVSAGLRFKKQSSKQKYSSVSLSKTSSKRSLNLHVGSAIKEIRESGGRKYEVYYLSTELLYPLTSYTNVGGSIDAFYDGSSHQIASELGVNYNNRVELGKIGAATCIELKLDRLSVIGHLGVYAYNRIREGNYLYQRIGLRYKLAQHLSANLGLKTHLNVADHFELGIVFRLN